MRGALIGRVHGDQGRYNHESSSDCLSCASVCVYELRGRIIRRRGEDTDLSRSRRKTESYFRSRSSYNSSSTSSSSGNITQSQQGPTGSGDVNITVERCLKEQPIFNPVSF